MSIRLKAELECLSQAGGQRLAEANNIGVVEQMGRLGSNRAKGALYILVEVAGVSKSETERLLVDILAAEYEHGTGSITACLRQAIAAANRHLYTGNQKALPEMRVAAGVSCAVIRETDVFLAQAGPSLAYILHQDTFQRAPVDSPWLSPDRAAAFPYMFPLGKRPEVDPDLFHSPLQPGDTILMSTVALAHGIPQAQVKQIMGQSAVGLMMRQVATLAGREDFSAIALAITEQADEEDAEAEESETSVAGENGMAARLRGSLQRATTGVAGLAARAARPFHGRADAEEIDVPEMVPPPRVAPLVRADGSADMGQVPARPYAPEDGQPVDLSATYAQTGFLEDVVAPRSPRPLVDRPPLGVPADGAPEPMPWTDMVGHSEEEWVDEPAPGQDGGGLTAALSGLWGGLSGGVAALAARLRPPSRTSRGERQLQEIAALTGPDPADDIEQDQFSQPPWFNSEPEYGGEITEETPASATGSGWQRLVAGKGFSLAAVAVLALAAVLIGGLAITRYQEDQEKARQFDRYVALAQEQRGMVLPTTERGAARSTLALAEQAAAQALALRPDDQQARALYESIQASLDTVNLVVRLNNVATLVEIPETNSSLGRIVVNGLNVFFLDTGQNRVYKYLLMAAGATEVQKQDVNPVLVRKGDEAGNIVAGDIVDIVWMPAGGARASAQFMALESGGYLVAYNPASAMQSLTVRESGAWRKVRNISSFQGNLYVMDTQQNRILKYEPTARGYENAPTEWLRTAVDLTDMVDLAIDGDVYLLSLSGKLLRFRGGLALAVNQPALDKPMANPASMFTAPNVASIYVVDPTNKRIVQLGKDGTFERQYHYGGKDGAFDALRSVYVDEALGKMYITSGKKVLVASIPR